MTDRDCQAANNLVDEYLKLDILEIDILQRSSVLWGFGFVHLYILISLKEILRRIKNNYSISRKFILMFLLVRSSSPQ